MPIVGHTLEIEMRFTITVGTAHKRARSAREGFVGRATQTIEARSLDAAMRQLAKSLERRGLRPIGHCSVEVGS